MEINKELVQKAYKKLKSSVYYDKTQLALRNKIVEFEHKYPDVRLDKYLEKIYKALKDDNEFDKLANLICKKVSVTSLPKTLARNDKDIISNFTSNEIIISQLQHYIDMPVEGHIIGVLWIMLLGYRIDKTIYEYSYGNRIRKNLINEFSEEPTYSPYLFEPYFEQYESWRDNAMAEAEKHMSKNQDVVIITMDFRRYYYSLDIDENLMSSLLQEAILEEDTDEYKKICHRINLFVGRIISEYSRCFGNAFKGKRILPIGFLPSNIIGNWCLNRFDKAIIDGWNPVYYGRYVDDILIVDKVERNSDIQIKAKSGELTKENIIEFFLTNCSRWNGFKSLDRNNAEKYAIIEENAALTKLAQEEAEQNGISKQCKVYSINPYYNPSPNNKSEIIVHNDKVKIFYFKHDESDALITCFKNNISKNKSEFRHLPEDEAVFQKDDYSDIYVLSNNDTLNKFRGVDGISLDKFKLSKFLGKYLRIGGMVQDKAETRFEKDILKIFNSHAIIENYAMWDKIIEILTINERFSALESFCKRINEAVETIDITDKVPESIQSGVKKALYDQLYACICRSFALVWKKERKELQDKIYIDILSQVEKALSVDEMVLGYFESRMIDKSVVPIVTDMIDADVLKIESGVNLSRFDEVFQRTKHKWESKYKYYPYIIGMYDFGMVSCVEQMNIALQETDKSTNTNIFENLKDIQQNETNRYAQANYQKDYYTYKYRDQIQVKKFENGPGYEIIVGDGKKNELKIAIANVRLNRTNFEKIVKDIPNRQYSRYKDLTQLVNLAIDQRADMLIMPEAYVPYEWLPTLARTCVKNKLAIVTGVEHIKYCGKIFNFTATILPYTEDTYKCAHISFHLKNHYAPSEIEKIEGYRLKAVEGKNYELYKWNDCYFAVYCCYELTSILDRSAFQSYADMIVAVEWNRDVKYYSNILESLSRDLHCYCIQVNSSEYGDSRITKPSKSEEKDIIRTKGGINSSILVDDINIAELRNFQLKEYSLQQKDTRFKVTPPNFDKDIVMKKIKGEALI